MADTPKHSVSVAGIVVDDEDRVLVIQRRDNGHWEPPGGALELDETPQDGVKREIFEETGVHVEVQRLTGVYKNMPLAVVALVFRCTPNGGEGSLTEEATDIKLITHSEIDSRMDASCVVRVRDALANQVAVRSHDGINLIHAAASMGSGL